MSRPAIYGLLAEFHHADAIVEAAHDVHAAGYRRVDAYTPYPIEELIEALHIGRSRVPRVVLAGGITGLLAGFGLQYWSSVIEYPLNIGGRPLNSWPAFIVPSFETTVLLSALAAVVGMLALNGLPLPYHPVFNVPGFALASQNRFFICIEATDPRFDREGTREFLEGLGAVEVTEVAH